MLTVTEKNNDAVMFACDNKLTQVMASVDILPIKSYL